MSVSLPLGTIRLTKDYLNSVLSGFKTITEVEIQQPSTHGGLSVVNRIFLTYDDSTSGIAPRTIISKQSIDPLKMYWNLKREGSDFMRHGNMYKREVFLNNYFKASEFLPNLYYSKIDDDQEFIMLMEDCSSVQTIKGDNENVLGLVLDYKQMSIVIEGIANFHAEFYHLNEPSRLPLTKGIVLGNKDVFMSNKGLHCLPEYFQFVYWTMNHADILDCKDVKNFPLYEETNLQKLSRDIHNLWSSNIDFMLKIDCGSVDASYKAADIERKLKIMLESNMSVEERCFQAFRSLTEEAPLTIVHGDCRGDNLLIQDDHLKLIDWQCTSLGCGVNDVMMLMYTSMTYKDLLTHEEDLLRLYVETLQERHCVLIDLENIRKWMGCVVWYEFKNLLVALEIFKNTKANEKQFSIGHSSFEKLVVRKLVMTIYGVHKYCYELEGK